MHTLSSARRTCMASASAVECTATVWMPISLQARLMRRAISPRLAIRIFSNISGNDEKRLAELDRLGVVDTDLADFARSGREDRVHRLHRFDDEERIAFLHRIADFDERRLRRFGCDENRADHGGCYGSGCGALAFYGRISSWRYPS